MAFSRSALKVKVVRVSAPAEAALIHKADKRKTLGIAARLGATPSWVSSLECGISYLHQALRFQRPEA